MRHPWDWILTEMDTYIINRLEIIHFDGTSYIRNLLQNKSICLHCSCYYWIACDETREVVKNNLTKLQILQQKLFRKFS